MIAEDGIGEVFDGAVARDQRGRRLRADARNAGISVRGIADQREVIGNPVRRYAELGAHAGVVAYLSALAIDLHDAIADHALREILVRSPDADLLDVRIRGSEESRGGQRIIRFQL